MDHRRGMTTLETGRLAAALRGNGEVEGGGLALLMGRDTSFTGTADGLPEEEVIVAVKSVPVHY